MSEHDPTRLPPTAAPFAKAYGVNNVHAQEALRIAAVVLVDEALEDVKSLALGRSLRGIAPDEYKRIKRGGGFEAFRSIDLLPPRCAEHYQDERFLHEWIVTLTVVGWKLAQTEGRSLANVAEELALYSMIREAQTTIETRGQGEDAHDALEELLDPSSGTFEDNDFLFLYDDELPATETRERLGMTPLDFENWFRPFGDGVDRSVAHPFTLDGKAIS